MRKVLNGEPTIILFLKLSMAFMVSPKHGWIALLIVSLTTRTGRPRSNFLDR